jgi:hypothetical protein
LTPRSCCSELPSLSDERAFVWLSGQALTGACGEGDDAASALWKRHWRARGDTVAAAAADEMASRSRALPFMDLLVHVDIALYAFAAAILSFWIALGALVARRGWRDRPIATLGPDSRRLMLWAWVACAQPGQSAMSARAPTSTSGTLTRPDRPVTGRLDARGPLRRPRRAGSRPSPTISPAIATARPSSTARCRVTRVPSRTWKPSRGTIWCHRFP